MPEKIGLSRRQRLAATTALGSSLLIALATSLPALSADVIYSNGVGDNNWFATGNWQGGAVPNASDGAFLRSDTAGQTALIAAPGAVASRVILLGDANLTVGAGGTLTLLPVGLNDGALIVGQVEGVNPPTQNSTLTIQSGGVASAVRFFIGDGSANTAQAGIAIVTGAGSTLTIDGANYRFIVGATGTTSLLRIDDGAVVNAGSAGNRVVEVGLAFYNGIGTLQIGNGGASGTLNASEVRLFNTSRLVFNQSDNITFAPLVSGTGSLEKQGSGTVTLSTANTYTGATVVTGGSLIVNGSLLSSSGVTVGAGATIGGSGTLPSLTINGTLAPGNSPGTLTVNGNLVLGAGSVYLAEVQGAVADRVNVTGTASLAGTLRLVPLGGAYLFAAPYTLLSAAGGLGGTSFGSVDTAGSFGDGITSSIAYTGTEVRLTLTPKPLTPIVIDPVPPTPSPQLGVGRPANALSVASGIDAAVAAGADPSLLFVIYNLPAAAIPAAVNQLSGEAHTAAPAMAHVASDQFLRTMLDGSGAGRLSGALSGPGGAAGFTADLPSKQDGPGRPSFDPARFSLWGATFGSTGRNDGDRAVGSANRNLSDGHVAVGADIRLGANTVAGVAVAGGQSRASLSGGLGKAQADVFQAGLYGRTTLGTVNLAAALAYARLETDTTRAIPALSRSGVTASYATQAWSGRIGASLPVATWHGLTLSPFAAFQAVRASSPAAVERDGMGATAGMLTLARRSDMTSRSELGLQLDTSLIAGATPVTGFVRAAWTHYYQRDAELTASLNGLPGASFTATGARPDRNAALLAAGADIRLSQSVSLGARIDADLSGNTRRVGGTAKLSVSF
ncbi:MAG: autotransporter domain-containing protein [Kaiparowitsia implicata GSE-PSE-MK54-09C]|jgi:autotransporter-associated beta strand protein/T5SS/PEP-CTERM-associated repeat protein|nr:autotransporter domain-containing protein [Kaiparowitsia implicata GSE-PSE-MK54-09C]